MTHFSSHDVPKNDDIITEVLYFYMPEIWYLLLGQYILHNFKYSKVHKALENSLKIKEINLPTL